jgi:hypothetical protein
MRKQKVYLHQVVQAFMKFLLLNRCICTLKKYRFFVSFCCAQKVNFVKFLSK